MLRAIGYIRVSTDEQHLGPEAQRAALVAWAAANGAELVEVHEDRGVSGAAPLDRRPGLLSALAAIGRGGVLLAAKRDRLARDVIIAATVERLVTKAGGTVRTADGASEGDGPESQLMRTLLDAFAQYERAAIAARTKAALGALRSQGKRISRFAPFGFRFDAAGNVLPDEHEQDVLREALDLRDEGATLAAIAAALNARGHRTRSGGSFHRTAVQRVLKAAA